MRRPVVEQQARESMFDRMKHTLFRPFYNLQNKQQKKVRQIDEVERLLQKNIR